MMGSLRISLSSSSPLGDSENNGPRTSELENLPQMNHHAIIIHDDHRRIIQSYSCRKGKSHIKSKGENQLATDYFEALFETSK